jgi:hypothetical protein
MMQQQRREHPRANRMLRTNPESELSAAGDDIDNRGTRVASPLTCTSSTNVTNSTSSTCSQLVVRVLPRVLVVLVVLVLLIVLVVLVVN